MRHAFFESLFYHGKLKFVSSFVLILRKICVNFQRYFIFRKRKFFPQRLIPVLFSCICGNPVLYIEDRLVSTDFNKETIVANMIRKFPA